METEVGERQSTGVLPIEGMHAGSMDSRHRLYTSNVLASTGGPVPWRNEPDPLQTHSCRSPAPSHGRPPRLAPSSARASAGNRWLHRPATATYSGSFLIPADPARPHGPPARETRGHRISTRGWYVDLGSIISWCVHAVERTARRRRKPFSLAMPPRWYGVRRAVDHRGCLRAYTAAWSYRRQTHGITAGPHEIMSVCRRHQGSLSIGRVEAVVR